MRIIIDVDDDVWADAFGDWDEAQPPTAKRTWVRHTAVVKARVLAALGMKPERVRFIEEPTVLDDETDDDEDGGE